MSKVQVEEIDQILLLGFQGWIQGCFWSSFLPRNVWIRRWCSGVRILGPMSGVMNQCWVFSDLPSEDNLLLRLTVRSNIEPKCGNNSS